MRLKKCFALYSLFCLSSITSATASSFLDEPNAHPENARIHSDENTDGKGECSEPINKRAKLQSADALGVDEEPLARFYSAENSALKASLSPSIPFSTTNYILSFIKGHKDMASLSLVSRAFCNYVDERPQLIVRQNITDEDLEVLLRYKTKLSSVNLARRNCHIDRGLKALSLKRGTLVSINLENCSLMKDSNLSMIEGEFPKLTQLILSNTATSDRGLVKLAAQAPCLASLYVSGCSSVSYVGLMQFAKLCPLITSLNMAGCSDSGNDSFGELLKSLPRLNEIFVGGSSINDRKFEILAMNSKQLESLHIWECRQVTDVGMQSLIANLSNLTSLDIYGCELFKGRSLGYGTYMKLSSLKLRRCNGVTNDGLIGLLSSTPNLISLSLRDLPLLDDVGVASMIRMVSKLTFIDLTGLNVADMSVEAMSVLHDLATLNLTATKITDHGLDVIVRNFQKLAEVSFHSCENITNTGIARMREIRTGIKIEGSVLVKVAPIRSIWW